MATSWKIQRPQQARVRAFDDSDEERQPQDELLSGYGSKGSIRKDEKRESARPLVIPSQPNADWREVAKQRRQRAAMYLPDGVTIDGRAETPILGGGRGTGSGDNRDVMNAQPAVGGLKVSSTPATSLSSPALTAALAEASLDTPSTGGALSPANAPTPAAEDAAVETEEQRALRELLSGPAGGAASQQPQLGTISIAPDSLRTRAPTEDDAFRMDVEGRPETATIEDYERVPIDQFGAALLRGMGWKASESQVAQIPKKRPALLGLGAKESALINTNTPQRKDGRPAYRKPEPRFMPLVRKESESARSSLPSSRDRSRSPTSRDQSDDERRRRHRIERPNEYDSDRDRERRHRHRDTNDERSRSRERSRRDRYSDDEDLRRRRQRDRNGEYEARDRNDGRERERDRERGYDRSERNGR